MSVTVNDALDDVSSPVSATCPPDSATWNDLSAKEACSRPEGEMQCCNQRFWQSVLMLH